MSFKNFDEQVFHKFGSWFLLLPTKFAMHRCITRIELMWAHLKCRCSVSWCMQNDSCLGQLVRARFTKVATKMLAAVLCSSFLFWVLNFNKFPWHGLQVGNWNNLFLMLDSTEVSVLGNLWRHWLTPRERGQLASPSHCGWLDRNHRVSTCWHGLHVKTPDSVVYN